MRRKSGLPVHGWINLDKPHGLGSTDAVTRVRRLLNANKAGHAGTLDPLASGILPIALGEATKTVPYLMDADKTYRFTIRWGATTPSFDLETAPTASSDVRPAREQVEAALPAFVGEIEQVPPIYSAIRIGGERAYDLARDGQIPELASRRVTIHSAAVAEQPDADHVTLDVRSGKGVYIRAIVRDLATACSAHAHLIALRRTRVGRFDEGSAITLEKLSHLVHTGAASEALLPVETALDDIPALALTAEDAFRIRQGRQVVLLPRQALTLRDRLTGESRTVLATDGGRALALCEMRAGRLEPSRLFHLSPGEPDVDYA